MAFTVSLNGNNYISDKRKSAFEKALEDNRKVHLGGNGQEPSPSEAQPLARHVQSNLEFNTAPPQPQNNYNYARMFESLESGLAQSYGHQSETLHVHQQYLHNQAEYATIFSQLMQQQGELFANGATSPEQSEVTLTVIKSLAKSIELFHQHQTETLNVHNQFLNQQSQYAQEFVHLLRQHYISSNGGNGAIHQEQPALVPTESAKSASPVPQYKVRPRVEQPKAMREPEVLNQTAPAVSEYVKTVQPAVKDNQPSLSSSISITPSTQDNTVDRAALTHMLLSIVSEKTGYPAEMLEPDMDMEADLGIDSIKRVEIMGALQDSFPEMPDVDTEVLAGLRSLAQIISYVTEKENAPVAHGHKLQSASSEDASLISEPATVKQSDVPDVQELKTALLAIVSDKTGYPAEMLELGMDMEADLGIDSIKRVEILGALQDDYPTMPEIDADTLGGLRTLEQIINTMDVREYAEKKV